MANSMGGDVEWEPNEEGEDLKQPLPFKAKSELTSCKLYQVAIFLSPSRRDRRLCRPCRG